MGLIINDQIKMMMVGYPTVSDKYDVAGATLIGATNAKFGDLVKHSTTEGFFEKAASMADVSEAAGFVLATNVKLATGYPGAEPEVKAGEAFNLMCHGFMAIELDSAATASYVKANAPVYVILATGKCTTSDKAASTTIVELPGVAFTGTKETQNGKIVAEIIIK